MVSVTQLKKIPLFKTANASSLQLISQACSLHMAEQNEVLFEKGTAPDSVMLLLKGRVRVVVYNQTGGEIGIRHIAASNIFGEYAALDGQQRSATIIATEPAEIAMLAPAVFLQVLAADPSIAKQEMKDLVGMIRELTHRVYELSSVKAVKRIRNYLLRHSVITDNNRGVLSPKPTHSEIATFVSTQRPVVTRELKQLERAGVLSVELDAIVVNNLRALAMSV